ncbi:class I SAM-dependent methyltransferase [Ramlibacter humi]|uniref:Class I SAM-dependent methyltransferase n=1 Tax=Ramlibacter humi TaxID=2530451 RepID=A0A4Z0C0P7_9BURK|nr:class I SAM-dependent methyltransferase [Ramlibacter humi]TFZ03815.1 class I SAM-dependent methyltransferase [Ramlibacter humi]
MRLRTRARPCSVCGSADTIALPSPGTRSMRSDGLVVGQPLSKWHCVACASVFRAAERTFHKARSAEPAYVLNAKADNAFDLQRHSGYADVVADAIPSAPAAILDVGCGNGALLTLLGRRWPAARRMGVEPAALPRAQAAQRGIDTAPTLGPGLVADLVVSINVLEHTTAPAAFLSGIARALRPGGICVLVWPDDRTPSSELLLNDHLHTLSTETVRTLAACSGLEAKSALRAPAGFQGLRLAHGRFPIGALTSLRTQRLPSLALARQRGGYLGRWAALDANLLERTLPEKHLVAFGNGEAAQTLRAYAPRAWSRVHAISADVPVGDDWGLPVIDPAQLEPDRHQLLLATHPRWQARLRARFEAAGIRCLSWDDLVAA